MFFLLILVVALHQTYSTLIQKQEKWPLRSIVMRLIEYIGRVFLFPIIIMYYVLRITSFPITFIIPMTLGVAFIWYRESFGLVKISQLAIKDLIAKANNPESKLIDFSKGEIFLLNYIMFKKISFQFQEISNHLSAQGSLDVKMSRDLSPALRDVDVITERESMSGMSGIQLLGRPRQASRYLNHGRDSDDEDEDNTPVDGNRKGEKISKSRHGSEIIITNPVHNL